MDKNYYILSNGRLKRKNNTIYFESQNGEESIPVEKIENLYLFGNIDLNTQLINIAAGYQVPIHFFSYYGYYTGTFFPMDRTVSGKLLLCQIEHHKNKEQRLFIASSIVKGSANNILNVLQYYQRRNVDLKIEIENIKYLVNDLENKNEINEIMANEANIRKIYYSCWNKWLDKDFEFYKRSKRPPEDKLNTLISFLNSVFYSTVLSEIYVTQLDPTISFLHEPGERRYSLSLDIADIFKPIIVDRLIFYLVNKQMVDDSCFEEEENICFINTKGKKIVLKEYDAKLGSTFYYKKMEKYISYRMLIRVECYKLIKHILGVEIYNPFRMEW
ncbi:MAG: CRISPR-associated endonuclease Cas1 [candidate division TA06 bacterium 32_111]|uniref:CRISPR-associated endonuclease Cas1 n=1 Tax=candidate division WOR-3 bacterium TaxID=2052148 RepID=A0A348MLK3_UNCW3|nr:MAG: CRISPR-associated endonuclease Cas1 [candidate division TA06 bacterium 32_111]HAF07929.1 subtype I-B CRISPR-associated endonuclease Cas1 [candidate division WOR-3 bacterium]HCP16369.1 subtype I-B CRISPR-associated endonuclease Cas1 [candidate division WOR-3 bacterium]